MKILGIETSFDETGVAIVENGETILSQTLASSASLHKKYGGVVPEIAARKQVELMIPVLTETLNEISPQSIDAIAVTIGPGLIGSLLVGVETAKTLAMVWNKPIIPVNHIHAHIYANFLMSDKKEVISEKKKDKKLITSHVSPITFPAIALIVSGGHTELFYMETEKQLKWIGGTVDDAAGECFDKIARLIGLESGGGPALAAEATKFKIHLPANATHQALQAGDSKFNIQLPRPMMHDGSFNFSFSGLKTALMRELKTHTEELPTFNFQLTTYLAHEAQEAITDVLVHKTLKAAQNYEAKSILLGGGVAANEKLREKFQIHDSKFQILAPLAALCTDNAAVVAACAYFLNEPIPWSEVTAQPNLSIE